MYNTIPCVILSGGQSSRMGEDKSLMSFDDKTMIEYLYKKLSSLFKEVYISSKNDKFTNLNTPKESLILDKNKTTFSPMIAMEAIFQTLKDDKIFIITVDTPFIKEETIKELIKKSNDFSITIAKDKQNNTHNLCGVFSRDILPIIQEMLQKNMHKINYMIKNSKNYQEIIFDDNEQFLNINTQESYQKAKTLLKKF